MKFHAAILATLSSIAAIGPGLSQTNDANAILERINLPDGFSISVFAQMPRARGIAVDGESGTVYVGSSGSTIYTATDADGDGAADAVQTPGTDLSLPSDIAIHESGLFIGLVDQVARSANAGDRLAPLEPVLTGITPSRHHGRRIVEFGPDGKLYVALGAPCNICALDDVTGKIVRLNADGSDVELVADGIRNSVGFDWHPVTQDLWFTDNGADGMGDDIPPDELNRVSFTGEHFGFPYFGGDGIPLPGFASQTPPMETTSPEIAFQAHTASLGIDFYSGDMFPADYKNDAFVAQHGSWNRSVPVGYRIMRVLFDEAGNPTSTEVFADGWLDANGRTHGRPVDLEELPDGSLLVSDDHAGLVYRITYDR